jgi:[acyl-carrier-protein] S-malonyltransferase
MLEPWLEDSESVQSLSRWSESIGKDLIVLGTTADADEIRDTANAQPLIVATGLIAANLLDISAPVISGHSVGEITAAAIANVISEFDAIRFVNDRANAMAKAASLEKTGMSAVLGGDREEVLDSLMKLGLVAANDNGAGQIVAAGLISELTLLADNPPTGARIRPLAVAGAFHSKFMNSAREALAKSATTISPSDPVASVISNRDGFAVVDGEEILERIVSQVANPVRWDLCMKSLQELGVTGVIELAPAGTLVGLLKRAAPEIETFAFKSPADLAAAKEFAGKHK